MSFSAASAPGSAKHKSAVRKKGVANRVMTIVSSSRCGSISRLESENPRARDSKDLLNFGQESKQICLQNTKNPRSHSDTNRVRDPVARSAHPHDRALCGFLLSHCHNAGAARESDPLAVAGLLLDSTDRNRK